MNIRKIIEAIAVGLIFLSLSLNAYAEPNNLKLICRDYNPLDSLTSVHPLTIGITSWTSKGLGTLPALYGSMAILSYKDVVRLECGGAITWDRYRFPDRGEPTISLITGFSTLIKEKYVVGVWMAPPWNLYGSRPDDAYGLMVGYAF